MGEKNLLKELLKEEQEPFQLRDYLTDQRKSCSQFHKQSSSSVLVLEPPALQTTKVVQLSKKPNSKTQYFCRNACFFSNFHDSPRKSPLYEFPSPLPTANCSNVKSPYRRSSNSTPLFLHVPPKTANMLLDAAVRIQQKHYSSSSKRKSSSGHGLFGSLMKRLTNRKRESSSSSSTSRSVADGTNEELGVENINETVRWAVVEEKHLSCRKDDEFTSCGDRLCTSVRSWEQEEENINGNGDNKDLELRSCSTSTGTTSNNSIDSSSSSTTVSCCCSRSEIDDETNNDYVLGREDIIGYYGNDDDGNLLDLCLSPISPFRFALYGRSPSSSEHHCFSAPDLSSLPPASSSPTSCMFQENYDQAREGENKEQNSPISILDPPFEDDDHQQGHEVEDGYDLERGYAFVQRAKQQILRKLHKFEKLAELDPLELEQRMLEEEVGEYEKKEQDEEQDREKLKTMDRTKMEDELMKEIISKSFLEDIIEKPGVKRLLSDILTYEKKEQKVVSRDRICYQDDNRDQEAAFSLGLVQRVMDSWKQIEQPNTIDMMVEIDLKRENDLWKNHRDQIGETAMEIEVDMFDILVEEFTQEILLSHEFSCWL